MSRSPGPDAKDQGDHQPIEIKFGMRHYSHKSMPDAKFEPGSCSSFGDMTSQNFPLKKGTIIEFLYLPPESGFKFKNEFLCPEFFFSTQNLPCQFQQFQAEENFSFSNVLDVSMRKDQQQPPD